MILFIKSNFIKLTINHSDILHSLKVINSFNNILFNVIIICWTCQYAILLLNLPAL